MNVSADKTKATEDLDDWQFHHIGLIVRNLDQATAYYRSLGFETSGPEVETGSHTYSEYKVHGKSIGTFKSRIRFIEKGSVRIELIQPVEGQTPQQEFLDSHGEGVSHIAFWVGNFDREATKLTKQGVSAALKGKSSTGDSFAYFDTRDTGNIMIELVPRKNRKS
jgi:catechol 2,3-dioxygenase-like lactoylglutathione lyase family enzyme